MFNIVKGDLFDSKADCIVNTVNCKGVMGAGLALQFKKRFPEMFEDYRERCRNGEVKPGVPFLYDAGDVVICNFPTKDDWREPSEMEWITSGLMRLVLLVRENGFGSIAIPPLGAGLGGLDPVEVSRLVWRYTGGLKSNVLYYLNDPEIAEEVKERIKEDSDTGPF